MALDAVGKRVSVCFFSFCSHCQSHPPQTIINALRDILGDYVDVESLDEEKFQIGAWDGTVSGAPDLVPLTDLVCSRNKTKEETVFASASSTHFTPPKKKKSQKKRQQKRVCV